MKKLFIILAFLLLLPFYSFSQKPVLVEYEFVKYITDLTENPLLVRNRIVIEEYLGDTLFLQIVTPEYNMVYKEFGSVELKNDSLCLTTDCYDYRPIINEYCDTVGWKKNELIEGVAKLVLNYKIINIEKKVYKVFINNHFIEYSEKKYVDPSYQVVNNDTVLSSKDGYYYQYFFHSNGEIKSINKIKYPYYYTKHFDENGNFTGAEEIDAEIYFLYDEEGRKHERISSDRIYREYDKDGNLIYEEIR